MLRLREAMVIIRTRLKKTHREMRVTLMIMAAHVVNKPPEAINFLASNHRRTTRISSVLLLLMTDVMSPRIAYDKLITPLCNRPIEMQVMPNFVSVSYTLNLNI